MTNTPNYAPQPKGGMPKWLIVLLVIFLVIVLGCCCGFITCTYFLRAGAHAGAAALQKAAEDAQRRMEAEVQREKDLAERRARDAGNGGAAANDQPENPARGGAPAPADNTPQPERNPGPNAADNTPAARLP